MSPSLEKVRDVKARREQEWLALEGVVAVGVGVTEQRGAGILVSVRELTDALRERIPRRVEGVPVEVRETGEVRAR